MAASLDLLVPDLQPWARALVDEAGRAGLLPRVTSTLRSHAEQERLYRRHLAGQQQYPVARPGTSAHEYGYAFDLVVSPMAYLADVGALWESWGGVWGGHPTRAGSGFDPVHFELPGWRESVQLQPVSARTVLPEFVREADPFGGLGAYALEEMYAAPQRLGESLGELFAELFK